MTDLKNLRKYIEAGRLDEIEDAWLAHLDEAPDDVPFFAGLARRLASQAQEEPAGMLLGMLDEELCQAGRWGTRLTLLQSVGNLWVAPESLHDEIVRSLRAWNLARGGDPKEAENRFEGLADVVGLYRAPHDIPKTWDKVERMKGLLALGPGSIVWMEGKGAGRILEVNLELKAFRVDFELHGVLSVGFGGASKLLQVLPKGHILRRKLDSPEEVEALKAEGPRALLGAVLTSYDEPLTAGRIRQALHNVVSEKEWSSWWTAARKSPELIHSGKGAKQIYSWASSGEAALDEIEAEFEDAEDAERLEIFRRYAKRDAELAARLGERLLADCPDVAPDEALAIWFTLDRAGSLPDDPAWTPEELLESSDVVSHIQQIPDRLLRERAYATLRKTIAEWPSAYRRALLTETDGKLLGQIASRLEKEDSDRLAEALADLLAHPRRHPAAFTWFAEHPRAVQLVGGRNPLRLLQSVLNASRDPEFAPFRVRLQAVVESGALLATLIRDLSPQQAVPARDAIHRAPYEEYVRTPLLNALELKFPELRKATNEALYATQKAIDERRAELLDLKENEIPANRDAIERARELGDLRENFEYKSARDRHEYLSARVGSLEAELSRVRPIPAVADNVGEVRIGTHVRVETEEGEKKLTILGPWESDPEAGIISYDSDLGGGLLGAKPGEEREISGRSYTVTAIESATG